MSWNAEISAAVVVVVAGITALLSFYWLIQRVIIAPRQERDREFYRRLDVLEKGWIREQGWREAHDDLHKQTATKIDTLIDEVRSLNVSLHDLDKRISLMENTPSK